MLPERGRKEREKICHSTGVEICLSLFMMVISWVENFDETINWWFMMVQCINVLQLWELLNLWLMRMDYQSKNELL